MRRKSFFVRQRHNLYRCFSSRFLAKHHGIILYNALDGIRDADGNRLIEGHSSVNGIMTIAVDAVKLEDIRAGLNEVTGLKWTVDDSFIGFLKPYQTKENNNARNDARCPQATSGGFGESDYVV